MTTYVYVEKYGIEVCHIGVPKPVTWTGGVVTEEMLPACGQRVDVAALTVDRCSYPPMPLCGRCRKERTRA